MKISAAGVTLLLGFTLGCGSSSKTPTSTVSGAYEFVVTSSVTGGTTLVEANMAANGNQSGATGPTQAQVLTFEKKTWYVNGICPGATPGQNSVAANVSGSNIAVMFNVGGNSLPGQGTLVGAAISGNYSITGSKCAVLIGNIGYADGSDSGGFLGNQVPALAGTFSGTLNLPDGNNNAAFTLTEGTDDSLSVSAQLTGPVGKGTFTLTGSAVANVMIVSGPVNGQTLSLLGYLDRPGSYTGIANSLLVFNQDTLQTVGTLLKQ